MSDLPLGATSIKYNGVTFPVETDVSKASFQPVQDPSRRTTSHVVVTLQLDAYFGKVSQALGDDIDATVEDLVQRLTTQGAAFAFKHAGYGDLSVNVQGGRAKDVVWGPIPKMLEVKSYGRKSCKVTWQVQVARPFCDHAAFEKEIMVFAWKLSISIDRAGYSRRVFNGHIEIPQTRKSASDRSLSDSADNYLERVLPRPLPGFRRTAANRTIDESKNRLDFDVTDEEMGENTPPPGVVDAEIAHSVESQSVWSINWSGSIRGKYELAKGTPVMVAWQHFLKVVQDRTRAFTGQTYRIIGAPDPKKPNVVFVRPQACSLSETNALGRLRTATFTWRYMLVTSLYDILSHSALFRPVSNAGDWERWAASLKDTAFHPRGNARLTVPASADAIVDLCVPRQERAALRGGGDLGVPRNEQHLRPQRLSDIPPPGASWIDYQCSIAILPWDNTHVFRTLPTAPVNLTAPPNNQNQFVLAAGGVQQLGGAPPAIPVNQVGSMSCYPPGTQDSVITQVGGRPVWVVVLSGRAQRAGYPIPAPVLVSVGGARAIPQNMPGYGFVHAMVGNRLGVPTYAATWRLRYVLDGDPVGNIPVMDAPFAAG